MGTNIANINWYPGHMKKTKEMILENIKLVDIVVEVVDSRIPISSRNQSLQNIISVKPRIIAMNKSDLADPFQTKLWKEKLQGGKDKVVILDSVHGTGIKQLLSLLSSIEDEINEDRVRKKNLRIMIVGIPNVGKSSLINRLTGRKSTKTGDKPGVTKGKQWLTLSNGMQMLDTPGILWPKFEDAHIGMNLAFCGSIKDEIMDIESLALELIKVLGNDYGENIKKRYKLEEISDDALENMDNISRKRGFIFSGSRIDYSRCARTVLDEFRSGIIGKITLEKVR